MGKTAIPHKACLFIGMLYADEEILSRAVSELRKLFGKTIKEVEGIPFDLTSYYDREMGEGIMKGFLFFEDLIPMDELAVIKRETNLLEERFSDKEGRRRVNLDPGYMDMAKIVLATTKDRGHRIYLRDGIFAEVELIYQKERYRPVEWTYPDYRKKEYADIFDEVRSWFSKKRKLR